MLYQIKSWIEAVRFRTIPVSIAGVIMAIAFAVRNHSFSIPVSLLCLTFAVLAQIASNFANEYYDFKRGFDKVGRDGPRRGVTEGDISPEAMKIATFVTLFASCATGLGLAYMFGLWLIPVGVLIAIGVLAYSTGPYPLSHHCLGEIAVVFFFGIIPVNFTYYLQSGVWSLPVALASVSIGLMGANVLIVNNYRDADDDRAVGKNTLAVVCGRKFCRLLYLANGLVAIGLFMPVWLKCNVIWLFIPTLYLAGHLVIFRQLSRLKNSELNRLLGMTAMLMFAYSLLFLTMNVIIF